LMVFGLPILVLLVSFFKPIFMARVIAWGAICAPLVVAAGIVALRRPVLLYAAITVLAITQVFGAWSFYPTRPEVSPYEAFAPDFETFDPGKDALVLGYQMLEPALRWYFPNAFEGAAYGFIYNDWNRNVIDAALVSDFTLRSDAEDIELPDGRLFVVIETERLSPTPEGHGVDDALATVIGSRTLETSVSAGRMQLDIYAAQ